MVVSLLRLAELPARCDQRVDPAWHADGDNVNNLVGSTSADTVPTTGADNYLFLVVDKSDGSIKAIDKTFIEAELDGWTLIAVIAAATGFSVLIRGLYTRVHELDQE